MADLTSINPQNSLNSSPFQTSENFKDEKNENRAAYLAPERFRSCWLGGWAYIVPDERLPVLKHDPKCLRETSFLTESADIVPDESSCVLKHDPKCAISSQLSMPCEVSHNKPDDDVLHSQDVVRCSNLSLIDPLCSVVPCSIASEHEYYKALIDRENDMEYFSPLVSDFEADKCQRNTTLDCRDEKITSIIDG
ncbi:unnamed protein product [Lathyrus sativus]|nr:unnamed protein product [Lathyrus sativus]